MTNAQKWVAGFLALFIILFLLGKFTKKDDPIPTMTENYSSENTEQTAEVYGLTLIQQKGCITCHGGDLNGTQMAPALINIKQHWTRDGLINYLRNPSSYSGDARFDEYRTKYKNIMMPSYGNLDVKDLGKMVEYLLTK